jgi:hypothetical protein
MGKKREEQRRVGGRGYKLNKILTTGKGKKILGSNLIKRRPHAFAS